MFSGGFSAALQQLGPEFERTTGNKIVLIPGPSMGKRRKRFRIAFNAANRWTS